MYQLRRQLAVIAATILAAALLTAATTGRATADSLLVTCPHGHERATYSPGLTLTPRNVHIDADGTIGGCTDVLGNRANGIITFQGNGQLTCLAGNASGTGTINWEPAGIPTTHFTWTGAVGARPLGLAVLVLTGTVTSGDLPGALLQAEFVLTTTVQQAPQCLTPQGTETNSGVLTGFSILNL
jgi:hypothetical protein